MGTNTNYLSLYGSISNDCHSLKKKKNMQDNQKRQKATHCQEIRESQDPDTELTQMSGKSDKDFK